MSYPSLLALTGTRGAREVARRRFWEPLKAGRQRLRKSPGKSEIFLSPSEVILDKHSAS